MASLRVDCEFVAANCESCAITRNPRKNKPPLQPFISSYPFHILCVDKVDWGKCAIGFKYAVLFIDHFSRFVIAEPIHNKSADEMAATLFTRVILILSCPKIIIVIKVPYIPTKL